MSILPPLRRTAADAEAFARVVHAGQVEEPTLDEVSVAALKLWQEREMRFPERVRRLKPDDLDYASGAWGSVCAEALEMLRAAVERGAGR